MNQQKNKILIIGGYGNVGKVISNNLSTRFPNKVIIAGRNKNKALQLINDLKIRAQAIEVDLNSNNFDDIDFKIIHTVISCIEFLENDNLLLSCIKNNVNYTELGTSYEAYNRLIDYEKEVKNSGICLIPGVGLMPGLSGIFVHDAISKGYKIKLVQSYILLGLGENHGLDAIRWMMKYANKTFTLKTENGIEKVKSFTSPMNELLLSENSTRKFYRFNFGDQHIISATTDVISAQTRLAFDSKFVTWLIVFFKQIGLLNMVHKMNPEKIKKWLTKFHFGSEKFGVQTHIYTENNKEYIYLIEGNNEAKATGLIAAYAVIQLYKTTNIGIKRLEQMVNFKDLMNFLEQYQINFKNKRI